MKKLFLFVALCGLVTSVSAQAEDEYVHRYIGIGIRASVFQISEIPNSLIPPNRLLISGDPIKYARAEFHFGAYRHESELFWSNNQPLNMQDKSVVMGFGLFGTYPCGKTKFIGGARYSLTNYSSSDVLLDAFGSPYTADAKGKMTTIAPVIGGEYYFAKWFSVGAEFSYLIVNDELTPADPNDPQQTSSTFITESSLLFRFYPF